MSKTTNHKEKHRREVAIAINYLWRNSVKYVSVKILRNLYGIKSKNRPKISFYREVLKDFEKEEYLIMFRKQVGLFKILKTIPNTPRAKPSKNTVILDLSNSDPETCICGASGSNTHKFINVSANLYLKFCSDECKRKYIYEIQKQREKYDF